MDAERDIRDIVQGLRQVAQVAEQERAGERRRTRQRGDAPTAPPRSGGPGPGHLGRRVLAMAALSALVVGVVLWTLASRGAEAGAPTPVPSATTATSVSDSGSARLVDAGAVVEPEQWVRVLGELDRRRVAALRTLDASRLDDYAVAGAAVLRRDRASIDDMQALGVHPLLRANRLLAVQEVSVQLGTAPAAVLRVVDRRPGYALVDAAGSVARRVPFRGRQAWEVRLRSLPGQGWRVASVRALPDADAASAQGGGDGASVGVVEAEAGVEQPRR